jgi:hypothetical protein
MKRNALFILTALILLACLSLPARGQPADVSIYTDALAAGWDDWSWGTTRNFANTSPVYAGTHSIAVTYTAAWGGLYLHHAGLSTSGHNALRFWVHGGANGGQKITFSANQNGSTVNVPTTANTWTQFTIPLTNLGNPATITDLVWQDSSGGAQAVFYIDQIALIATSPTPTATSAASTNGPALQVNAAAGQHPISPYIYGMNWADEALADELNLPVRRWGGNSTTRYNWQNDFSNTGSDWYYENIHQGDDAADQFVTQDRRTGSKSILTMPLIGWVSKDSPTQHPFACGFKVSKYGAQQSVDSWDTDCGNGYTPGGAPITGNNPLDTSIAITPAFVSGWVNHLVTTFGTAANGGVMFYNLDNEPMLWNSTHRDVHPTPTSYDELRDQTYAYAAAIKSADPSALTLGPVTWGWCAYFYSAKDGCSAGSDYAAHGNTAFTPWYLAQMHAYEQQHGIRILDYLDLHIYPQVNGVYADALGSASVQAARLRSTRQLWDPTYIHEGWINQPVYLIPRMKQWVSENYPGTKLAITEYNWGAHGFMNGALAQADLLGIFGREGLDLATLWGPPSASQPAAFAFRMYRNYDGQGGVYGETSLQAASADQEKLAIYAAQRSSDHALTLMVINKTAQSLTSTLTLSGFSAAAQAQVYRYGPTNLSAIAHQPNQLVTATGFTATFPENSITLFILAPGQPWEPTSFVWLPLIRR